MTSWSSLKRIKTMWDTAAKNNASNSNSDNAHPCRSPPCLTLSHFEYSPSSVRARAHIPSWNCRITAIIFRGAQILSKYVLFLFAPLKTCLLYSTMPQAVDDSPFWNRYDIWEELVHRGEVLVERRQPLWENAFTRNDRIILLNSTTAEFNH